MKIPKNIIPLLYDLDKELIKLLRSLSPEEWQAQTIAPKWKVKDVVAHLLDGNIRILSSLRDGYQGEKPTINSYQDLLDFLNILNADWVKAMNRVSPPMLILLHEITGKQYCDYYASLNPNDTAVFSVAWAGENKSSNEMHIAREYTEKFLHQQQIREATQKDSLLTEKFYKSFLEVCLLALPYTFREVKAEFGTTLKFSISGKVQGDWFLVKKEKNWELVEKKPNKFDTEVSIPAEDAWKLLSKSYRFEDIKERVQIEGDQELARKALSMVSFMV